MRKVRPVAVNPTRAIIVPGLIAHFDFRGDIVDRVSGNAFDAVLPATNGKTVERFGQLYTVGADQPRHTGTGVLLEGQATNKCECYKYNPVDTMNFILGGSAVISIVDDADELASSGLSHFGPNVYKVFGNGGWGSVVIESSFNSLNSHSMSVFARTDVSGGTLKTNNNSGNVSFGPTDGYEQIKSEGFSPSALWERMSIGVVADQILYFTLPQLEEGPRATSPIVGDNTPTQATSASEAADATGNGLSIPLDDIPQVKAALQSEGTMILKWVPGASMSAYSDVGLVTSNDRAMGLLNTRSDGLLRSNDGTSVALNTNSYSAGDILKAVVRWSDSQFNMSVNDNISTGGSFDGSFDIGTHLRLHFGNESPVEYQSLTFFDRALTDSEVANV